jgi:hypothetical protein
MALDENLLEQARATATRLADAERDALLARADYHTAIRRLHLGGAPLREIAQALSLSHQRVQQIVSAAGGSWWQVWRRRGAKPDAVCSWCGRPPGEVAKLIAGPKVYVCDGCVEAAERVGSGTRDSRGMLVRVGAGTPARCSFCRKRAGGERFIVRGPHNICRDCLRTCREILDSRAA